MRAEEARTMAKQMKDPRAAALLLELANGFDRLAEFGEQAAVRRAATLA
jgi:hypothetical protein